jgi:hypothetical protein
VEGEEDPAGPPEPFKLSRSGRIVKRHSFHDEVYQGEQHLRTAKLEPVQLPPQHVSSTKSQTPAVPRSKSSESFEQRKKPKSERSPMETVVEEPVRTEPESVIVREDISLKEEEGFAPVRMKPVLQPPAPAMRSIIVEAKTPMVQQKVRPTDKESVISIAVANDYQACISAPVVGISNVAALQQPKLVGPPLLNAATTESTSTAPLPPIEGPRPTERTPSYTSFQRTKLLDPKKLEAAIKALPSQPAEEKPPPIKVPRRKPGARECMQISRRFGVTVIPEKHMKVMLDYCSRGKVEHLIRMRERLDCHSRYLESQIAGLEMLVQERGETDVVVPPLPDGNETTGRGDGSTPQNYSRASNAEIGTGIVYSCNRPTSTTVQANVVPQESGVMQSSIQAFTSIKSYPTMSQTAGTAPSLPGKHQKTSEKIQRSA